MKKFIFLLLIAHCSLLIVKADWVNVTHEINNLNINALTATGIYIFAGNDQYVYRSSNNGDNWQQIYNLKALALASNGSYIYRGYENGYNYSTNYGANWLFAGLNQWTLSLLTNGNYVYAGCFWPIPGSSTNRGVWLSTNYGANWTQTALNYINVYSMTVSGSYLFAGGYNTGVAGGVFVSTNNGQSWTNPLGGGGDALAASGNMIYTGGGSSFGVYKSTNYGANWTQTSLNNVAVNALTMYGNYVFAGASNGFYVSNDSGTTWLPRNEGWGTPYIVSLCIHNNFLFSGTPGVWRRPLSELVGIKQTSIIIPEEFKLEQNYPNPFNPTTSIAFNISKKRFVQLIVYDILGKKTAKLVNEDLKPGAYEVNFDGSLYSSGTYFYQLIVDGKVIDSKKMILNK